MILVDAANGLYLTRRDTTIKNITIIAKATLHKLLAKSSSNVRLIRLRPNRPGRPFCPVRPVCPVLPARGIFLHRHLSFQITCLQNLNGHICKEVGLKGCSQGNRKLSDL